MREQLACDEERGRLQNDCLQAAGCAVEAMTPCYENAKECPMVDPQVLTQVLMQCPGARVLSRP